MDLISKSVKHEIFGEGTICAWDEKVISVRFGTEVKKFIFPDAFREHLILPDKQSKKFVDKILDEIDEKTRVKREESIREAEKMLLLKKLPVCSKAQAAFGFIENDREKVLSEWTIFAGNYRSGYNRGKPRIPTRIYPNTACLLTCCDKKEDKKESEDERYIFGVFMVKEDFLGSECSDGIIPAHHKYRIILNDEQMKDFLLWDYFRNEAGNKSAKWGSAETKYFSNMTMAIILNDILSIMKGTDQQKLSEDFLNYYCKLNGINKRTIPGFVENTAVSEHDIA